MADGTIKIATDLSTEGFKNGLTKLGSIAKTGLSAVTASITAVGAALGAAGGYAVSTGSQFETAFAQVQTIMDDTEMSCDAMKSGLKSLSTDLGVSFTELSETAYNAISATGDTAGALNLTETAAKLAVAGFTDTSSALSTLTSVMNAYGYTAEDAMNISDKLIMLQNQGVTTIDQLSGSMGKAIATASAYGIDLDNLESAYVSLTKIIPSTEEATTYVSSMFNELGDAGSKVSSVLRDKTGKSFGELMESGMSLGDVLGILNDSVNGNSEALINLWGSAEAGKAANAIVSYGLDNFNDNLKTIQGSTNVTQKAYETMCDTLSHKTEVLKTSVQGLGSTVYDSLDGTLKGVVEKATGYVSTLDKAFSKGLKSGVAALGEVVSTALSDIAGAAPEMIDAAVMLIDNFLSGLEDNLPRLADSALEIGESLVSGIVKIFPRIFKLGGEFLSELASGIYSRIQETDWGKVAKSISAGLKEALKSAADYLKEVDWKEVGETLRNGLTDFLKNIEWGEIFGGLWDVVKEASASLMDFLNGLGNGLGALVPLAEGVGAALAAWKIGSSVTSGIDKIMGLFGKKGVGAVAGESGSFKIPSVKDTLKGFADIALIIGGAVAVVEAIGLLSSVPGFNEAMSTGVTAIKTAFQGIGSVALELAGTAAGVIALGKIGASTVVQGLGGLALILDGVPVVITALGALMSIPGFSDFLGAGVSTIKTAFGSLGDVALEIGAFSALIVGLGLATPATILSGLAGFALVIGGLETVLVALGALNQIPGFSWIVGEGGKALMQLGEILGGFVGSIVEGALTEISDGFPQIADNLSLFAEKLEPFLSTMERVDSGTTESAKALADTILALSVGSLIDAATSWLTGGSSMTDFADQLIPFGEAITEFSSIVSGNIDEGAVTAAANAGKIMAEMANTIPNSGGVVGFFAGENDLSTFAKELLPFARAIVSFSRIVDGNINEGAVTAAANAGKVLSEMAANLPNQGGLVSWFTGDNTLSVFGKELLKFGPYLKAYASSVSGISTDVVQNSANAALALAELANNLPNQGGVVSWFTGDNKLSDFGAELVAFGEYFRQYYDQISGIGVTHITAVSTAAGEFVAIAAEMKNVDTGKVKDFGEAIAGFGEKLSGTDWDGVSEGFSSGMSAMLSSLSSTISGMQSDMGRLESSLLTVWGRIVSNASLKWEQVKTTIQAHNDSIYRQTTQKWEAIRKSISSCVDSIRTDSARKWDGIVSTIRQKTAEIQKVVSDGFSQAKVSAVNRTTEMVNAISGSWGGLASKAYSWGTHIPQNLAAGINDDAWRVSNAASNLAEIIRKYLHFSEPDVGPLSDFHTYMPDMVRELADGMDKNKGLAEKSAAGIASAISSGIKSGGQLHIPIDVLGQLRGSGVLDEIPLAVRASSAELTARALSSSPADKPTSSPEPIDYDRLAEAIANIQIQTKVEMDGKPIATATNRRMGRQMKLERRRV